MDEFASALTILLVVEDPAASRDWYERVLGAQVHREYGEDSTVMQLMGTWLLLVSAGGPTPGKPTVTFAPPGDPDRVSTQMVFRVADCRATYAALRERGADFLAEPNDRGPEIRAFFRDPDGHLFEISELAG